MGNQSHFSCSLSGLVQLAGGGAIEHAIMTSVHAYISDQILQDYAGPDYRRSPN